MKSEEIAQHLQEHGVRPTAVRIMVWRTLQEFNYAFALADLEGTLPTVDKSTLFRALTLFAEHEMLHVIEDGSGQHKYCVCLEEECEGHCLHEDGGNDCSEHQRDEHHHELCQHVHVTCTRCGRTFCIKDQRIPLVSLPHGFVIEHVNYVVHGLCPKCSHVIIKG